MNEKLCNSVSAEFRELSDPRVEGRCEHKLLDKVIIAVCAVITGGTVGWKSRRLGNSKKKN